MTKILGFAGKKQSGKNVASTFILSVYLLYLKVVRISTKMDDKGQLWISDVFGDDAFAGIFDIHRQNEMMDDFREKYVHPYLKEYSFADILKSNVCMNVLGLTYEQCYGTDEQKNEETHIEWENVPGFGEHLMTLGAGQQTLPTGPMTAREVMQYVGTDMFRKMYNNVWVDSTIKRIQSEDTELAIITDCRFPNEVEGIQKAGGKVIRFTRNPHQDNHTSETALDKNNYDWDKFDAVIDNMNMSINQQNEAVYEVLRSWDYIPKVE